MYFIFSFWPLVVTGQVVTGFESGLGTDWEQYPVNHWEPSPELALSGSYSLHQCFDSEVNGTDRISCKTGIFNLDSLISWEFSLRHGYTPSASNNWAIYLGSDIGAHEAAGNGISSGYILGVNVSGSEDTLKLFSAEKGNISLICSANLNYEKDIGLNIFHCRISRDPSGSWEIRGGNDWNIIGSGREQIRDMPPLKHFMISYSFTSTKDKLFWFDDLSIQSAFLRDTIPPRIEDFSVAGDSTIIIDFSEDLDRISLLPENFSLIPGSLMPREVRKTGNSLLLFFNQKFVQGVSYRLIINNIHDLESNILVSDTIDFLFYRAVRNDLIITEIMADPSPPVFLPESEYIELYNRSGYPLNIDSFIVQTGAREWILPESVIKPASYLVLSDQQWAGDKILPVFSSNSTLSNDGQLILIKDKSGNIISAVEFNREWYRDDNKMNGGWSLERINSENLCGGRENWMASSDPTGGTPGRENSVYGSYELLSGLMVETTEFIDSNTVRLVFNRNIDPSGIPGPAGFRVFSGGTEPDSLIYDPFICNHIDLLFRKGLLKDVIYELELPQGIEDCEGNPLITNGHIRFGIPREVHPVEIIMTEVMFDVIPGCSEYIEIYNNSGHIADLSGLRLTIGRKEESTPAVILTDKPVLFFPGEYKVLCSNKKALMECHIVHYEGSVIESSVLPSLPDDGGCIKILNRSLQTIDVYCYDPGDGFPLLSDNSGVSLERLTIDNKTGDESPWHSASSLSGFGTPGEENSQMLPEVSQEGKLTVVPETFSPDGDGMDDILEVSYILDREGFTGTFAVFDPAGRMVCLLGENQLLGTRGIFIWDGRDDSGNICNTGLYLIYGEAWNLQGRKERFKKVAVLVRQ